MDDTQREIENHIKRANERYGYFASAHEGLGVALEEWTELIEAIHGNDLEAIREEAIDLAAVLIRLADNCRTSLSMRERSVK